MFLAGCVNQGSFGSLLSLLIYFLCFIFSFADVEIMDFSAIQEITKISNYLSIFASHSFQVFHYLVGFIRQSYYNFFTHLYLLYTPKVYYYTQIRYK